MRKNNIGLMCLILLVGLCSFGQNVSTKMKTKALEALKNTNLKDYQNGSTELFANYEEMEKKNDSLEKVLEAKANKLLGIEMQLKYMQLREQLETGKLSDEIKNDISETRISDSSANQINIHFFVNGPCPECETIFAIDSPKFKQIYPLTYNLIKNGTIKLNYAQYPVNVMSGIVPVPYPPFFDTPKNTDEQKRLANFYLQSIKDISRSRTFNFDVMALYTELENENVPNKEVKKLITFRKEYIVYLKNYKP